MLVIHTHNDVEVKYIHLYRTVFTAVAIQAFVCMHNIVTA